MVWEGLVERVAKSRTCVSLGDECFRKREQQVRTSCDEGTPGVSACKGRAERAGWESYKVRSRIRGAILCRASKGVGDSGFYSE